MKLSESLQLPSAVASPDQDLATKIVTSIFTLYENKDVSIVDKYFLDGGFFRFVGQGTATGLSSIAEAYEWMYNGTVGSRFVIRTITVQARQTVISFEGDFLFSRGGKVHIFWGMSLDREPKDTKFKSMSLYGPKLDAVMERWILNAGPIPPSIEREAL